MTACISRTFMWHNRWDADHCPCAEREPNWAPQPELDASVKRVTSVSLVTRVDLAGLLSQGMTTMPPLTEPTVELESGRTISQSSGTMLWRPTIGLDEDGAVLAGPAKPWTPACREVCANLWLLCSDWPSSADELIGPLNAFSAGAPLWNVECWTASRWTGNLDLMWDRTSRSWWSSQETGAPWWLSGSAVEPVPEYLPWSASRLSRRVASHLAALTARWRVAAAWWTPVEKSPVQMEDKWTGTPSCWPRNADTCEQPDASAHEDRHRVYLSIPSTPDFWWLNGRTLEVWHYHVVVESGQVDYR